MHSDQIESRLRREAGRMTPPVSLRVDPASLPDRAPPGTRLHVPAVLALALVSVIATALLMWRGPAARPSASEAVARSMQVLPESAAVTRRIFEPVRQEMQALAMQSKRATRAVRESLQLR
ncbi:MAG: hypothetical protein U0570_03900 [Phycisphaerales bacterium]